MQTADWTLTDPRAARSHGPTADRAADPGASITGVWIIAGLIAVAVAIAMVRMAAAPVEPATGGPHQATPAAPAARPSMPVQLPGTSRLRQPGHEQMIVHPADIR